MAVYDCTIPPGRFDAVTRARVSVFSYRDYDSRWDELASIFSREAILKGAFDKFATVKSRRGVTPVDEAFLAEMNSWRQQLARHLALRNQSLTEGELNYSVQQILDRLIFLRICEDRGIEPYGQLNEAIKSGSVYPNLVSLFRRADDKYNSGLFHFRNERGRNEPPDTLTVNLVVDDAPIRDIVKRLYYPESPYEFSVLPAEILGQVYEQFLGQVVRLTPDHHAVVEDKPEVRRAGGVYYTPSHIVERIVGRTVGALISGKTPRGAGTIRILDPACGSGSFLIGAYQYLLDWHLTWYLQDGPARHKRQLRPDSQSGWVLNTNERKRILLNSIFGVDIDPQAVEVTKLSLLLKVLEGENDASISEQLQMFHERALPDLSSNIKCGNSLVGTDIQAKLELSTTEYASIRPFNWTDAFPGILPAGGFHVVIGNPPYDVVEKERRGASWPHDILRDYIRVTPAYGPARGGKENLFRYFLLRTLELVRDGGRWGMIVPLALLADISCARTRAHVIGASTDLQADCFPQKDNRYRRVFLKAKLSTVVVTGQLTQKRRDDSITTRVYPADSFDDPHMENVVRLRDLAKLDPRRLPVPLTDPDSWSLCQKIYDLANVSRLGDAPEWSITRGEINQTIYRRFITTDSRKARMLKGVEVAQYCIRGRLSQGEREWIDENRLVAERGVRPIALVRRIATQRITGIDEDLRIVAALVEPPTYFADSTNSISARAGSPYSPAYLLAHLNSSLYQWRFKMTSSNNNVGTNELAAMPFRQLDWSDATDVATHEAIEGLAARITQAKTAAEHARFPHERERLDAAVRAFSGEMEALVYSMFGLSESEIGVIRRNLSHESVVGWALAGTGDPDEAELADQAT